MRADLPDRAKVLFTLPPRRRRSCPRQIYSSLLPIGAAIFVWFCLALPALAGDRSLRLATTTSTENSGLLDHLLPEFEKKHGIKIQVTSTGTGRALKLGENGDVDLVMVHAPKAELEFVNAGFGVNRRTFMKNDFVLLGPPSDPAGVRGAVDLKTALERIKTSQEASFISRGDDSGTHQKELELWGLVSGPPAEHYLALGQGMEAALFMAHEKGAYTLSDRGTWLSLRDKLQLQLLFEGDPSLDNLYSLIAVNPARWPRSNYLDSMLLIAWLTSPEAQDRIASFQVDGEMLFHPLLLSGAAKAAPKPAAPASPSGHGLLPIIGLSFRVSLIATALAALLAVPVGLLVSSREFRGKRQTITLMNTLLSLPTVAVGLFVYILLSRSGPLGGLGLLFTPTAIVIGQVVLALPVITALTYAAVSGVDDRVRKTALTLGAGRLQADLAVLAEARAGLLAAVAAGFGRVISEVGSVIMLGGNIQGYTRTITTAIALETSKGEFGKSAALAAVLLSVALLVNAVVHRALSGKK